ncbi:MAG: hypothetical protein J6J35_00350 [Alphaproteobacteria bacterium]|nr:hypothetical protein [Alphaproteobacteria bacterium]
MTTDLKKLEAMQKQAYFESKLKMVPASIKDIYSAISGVDVLVARELVVEGHVLIGIEYTPEGLAASAYTTDKTGKRITLDRAENQQTKEAHAPKDLISERLNEAAKNISHQPIANEPQTSVKVKKAVRTNTPTNLQTLKELQNSKRQNG